MLNKDTFQSQNFLILVVDDASENVKLMGQILAKEGYATTFATSGKQAIERVKVAAPDLILLDLMMPGINGIQVCKLLKEDPVYSNIPIIFLTGSDNKKHILEAFQLGAVDYITKPFNAPELLARVKTYLELKQAREEAVEAGRIKTEFLANISHEIRTPMNAVLGMAELLLTTQLNNQQRDFVATIKSSGENLLTLINDLLDFSKLEAGGLEIDSHEFSLNSMLEELIDLFAHQVNAKGLEIAYLLEPNVIDKLVGDSFRLRQIFINLIGNAIKFTKDGSIGIKVTDATEDLLLAKEKLSNQNQELTKLRFEVRDTGIGISEAAQQKLFKSFSQVDSSTTRKYGGTGLGLSICKQLVNLMGGEIGVESYLGKGANFWFTANFTNLPLENEANNLQGKRLLIVDKNNLNRQSLLWFGEGKGMVVDEAEDILMAINYSRQSIKKKKYYHFALIAMELLQNPDARLWKTIKRELKSTKTKLIVMGSIDNWDMSDRCQEMGFDDYLIKPLKYSKLLDCLQQEKEAGSCLTKDLTLLDRTEQKTDYLLAENKIAKWQNVKVLLVEDTISNQKVILNQLKLLGYEADCVNNGEEALEQLAESEYDLILMDCQMPLLDGEHTTRILRKQAKKEGEPKIIGLTAYAMTGDLAEIREAPREKCLAAGMNDYLSKPVGMKELSAMLEKWSPATIRQQSKAEMPMPNPESPMSANQSPIDVDRLHKYTGGDAELEAELLEVFAQEAERIIQEAKEAEARSDATSLTHLIHQLKGSSAYLGVRWMPELAAKLEKQARENNLQEAKAILTPLEQILQQVKVFLVEDGEQ